MSRLVRISLGVVSESLQKFTKDGLEVNERKQRSLKTGIPDLREKRDASVLYLSKHSIRVGDQGGPKAELEAGSEAEDSVPSLPPACQVSWGLCGAFNQNSKWHR